MNEKWMFHSLEEIEKQLNTNAASGLSRKAARSRRQKAGENAFFLLPRARFVDCIREVLTQPSLILLILLGVLLMLFDQAAQGRMILLLTVLYAMLLIAAGYWSGRVSLRTARASRPQVRVIREGQMFLLDCTALVPGDLVELESGDTVPCDLRLVTAEDLRVLTYLGSERSGGAYIRTLKDASAICTPRERNDITCHANMLYGGSVIEQGTARALVVETGKHTYIGALQGGFPLVGKQPLPESVSRLKRIASRIQTALLLAIVPLLCLCLIIGGDVGIPLLFSMLLCLCLANLIGNMETILRFGMSLGIFRAAEMHASETALIKTEHNPDNIGQFDVLMLFGRRAFSDGMTHIADVCLPDAIPEVHPSSKDADRRKRELIALVCAYGQGIASTPAAANMKQAELFQAAREWADWQKHRSAMRHEDLRVSAFSSLNADTAEFTWNDRHILMSVREGTDFTAALMHARTQDGIRRIEPSMAAQLRSYAARMVQTGYSLHWIATRENGLWILEGILASGEVFLSSRERELARLTDADVLPLLFLPATSADAAYAMRTGIAQSTAEIAVAAQFRAQNRSITSDFGKYRVYCGFSNEQLHELMIFLKKAGKRVAIQPDSVREYALLREADVCFAVYEEPEPFFSSRRKQEKQPRLSRGREDASAQRIRRRADVLIPRAEQNRGGLAAIIHAMYTVSHTRRNLSDLSRYLLYTQLLRMTLVLSTMLADTHILQPSQILFSGMFIDLLFSFLLLLRHRQAEPHVLRERREKRTWVHSVVEAVCAGILTVAAFLFIYRNFPNRESATTAMFLALALMQLIAFLLHMDLRNSLRLRANRVLLLTALALLLLLWLALVITGGLPSLGILSLVSPYGYLILIAPLTVLLVSAIVRLYLFGRFR